jgi:perosamine synthetase
MSNRILALEGGEPVVPARLVAHNWERFRKSTQEEIDAVVEVLKSGHLSIAQGSGMPQAEAMEREFAEWVGAAYALMVCNGTAALHCAVAGVGIEPGDEVIAPAYTFIGSVMPILHQNGIPVFVDVDPETFLIDPARIAGAITDRTRAIAAVDIHGLPADYDAINTIARKHGLAVIEDAAQAYGGTYRGKRAGSLGDAAGFSMCTTKQLMTGEGGIMTTNRKDVYERASRLRLFGELADMYSPARAYMSDSIGWNYKAAETISALARVKLRHLDDYVAKTQRNAEYLTRKLAAIPGLMPPVVPADRTHPYYVYGVRILPEKLGLDVEPGKLRAAVQKALAAENVRVARWQNVPVPAQPVFQKKHGYGRSCPWGCRGADTVSYDLHQYPHAFRVIEDTLSIWGLVPPNTTELMDCYAQAFDKVFGRIDKALSLYDQTETYVPFERRLEVLARPAA